MEIIKKYLVKEEDTALKVGTGSLKVLSTAKLLAFVENTAFLKLQENLEENLTTVGTFASFSHIRPTPVSLEIKVVLNLIEKNDKEYVFEFKVYDNFDLISEGIHKRYIIEIEKFLKRVNKKLEDAKK